jgi:hypothetical protein
VLVREVECASGRSAEGRILDPEVSLGSEEVVVTFRVSPRVGDQDCQGNPATPSTVEFGEPTGGRTLLDGAHDPPRSPTTTASRPISSVVGAEGVIISCLVGHLKSNPRRSNVVMWLH